MSNDKIQELTPKMASTVLDKVHTDQRASRLSKESVKMVFREYIGKNFPWYMKSRDDLKSYRYKLIDVTYQTQPSYIIKFYFATDEIHPNSGHNASYAEKGQFTINYDVKLDKMVPGDYANPESYFYNRAFLNGIKTLLNLSRETFNNLTNSQEEFTAKIDFSSQGKKFKIGDIVPPEIAKDLNSLYLNYRNVSNPVKNTQYSPSNMRSFNYSSDDMNLHEVREIVRQIISEYGIENHHRSIHNVFSDTKINIFSLNEKFIEFQEKFKSNPIEYNKGLSEKLQKLNFMLDNVNEFFNVTLEELGIAQVTGSHKKSGGDDDISKFYDTEPILKELNNI